MTDPADLHKAEDEARVATTARAFRARSRRVQLLRRVLPVVIVILAGGTVTWIALRTVLSDAERKGAASREIRLDNFRFAGQDAQGRQFILGAKGAIRDPETGLFRLVGPAIRLNLGGRKISELTADGGVFNQAANTVTIGPNVRISDGGSGFTLVTPEAVVDTQTGVVTGSKGVQGSGPLGTISASSYVIRDQGERVEFSGSGENKIRGVFNVASAGN